MKEDALLICVHLRHLRILSLRAFGLSHLQFSWNHAQAAPKEGLGSRKKPITDPSRGGGSG
jgi:hypothetical protein